MPIVKIRSESVNIDIRSELEAFDWQSPRWSHDKLIAASCFRYDKTPSFYVNLEGDYAGVFGDSGAYDSDWASGGIVKLLSYLRNETTEETEDYLLEAYGFGEAIERQRLIVPHLRERKSFTPLDASLIEVAQSPYLTKRGISAEVQARAGVGKSRHTGFVAIPWHLPDGRLANVKYRATRGKTFFYERGGYPIRQAVYGANLVGEGTCVICEAEIDALSWQTSGIQAVAIGGISFNRKQADIIRQLPSNNYVIAGDNDKAGARFNETVVNLLRNHVGLSVISWGETECKDANDLLRMHGAADLRLKAENSVNTSRLNAVLKS